MRNVTESFRTAGKLCDPKGLTRSKVESQEPLTGGWETRAEAGTKGQGGLGPRVSKKDHRVPRISPCALTTRPGTLLLKHSGIALPSLGFPFSKTQNLGT